MALRALLAATCLLLVPARAAAFDVALRGDRTASIGLTETLVFDHHLDNADQSTTNDHYSDLRTRLNLSLGVGDFGLSGRL